MRKDGQTLRSRRLTYAKMNISLSAVYSHAPGGSHLMPNRRKSKTSLTMSHQSQSAISLPTTPQEQCLQNSDLLHQILLQFITSVAGQQSGPQTRSVLWHNLPWSFHDGRNTLHSAALTSRAFYHSAIPLLWWRIDNLYPLLCLLPSFTMYHAERRGGIRNRYLGPSAGDFYVCLE
jgi:hypothetical protein